MKLYDIEENLAAVREETDVDEDTSLLVGLFMDTINADVLPTMEAAISAFDFDEELQKRVGMMGAEVLASMVGELIKNAGYDPTTTFSAMVRDINNAH